MVQASTDEDDHVDNRPKFLAPTVHLMNGYGR